MTPDYLINPEDWAAIAFAQATKLAGTTEGAAKLAEAKRFKAVHEKIQRLEAELAQTKQKLLEVGGDCPSNLPEKDPAKPNTEQGLYRKFNISRVDGSDAPGGKHHGCRYFVLDVDHDPLAIPALVQYALEASITHPSLARDMVKEYGLDNPKLPYFIMNYGEGSYGDDNWIVVKND